MHLSKEEIHSVVLFCSSTEDRWSVLVNTSKNCNMYAPLCTAREQVTNKFKVILYFISFLYQILHSCKIKIWMIKVESFFFTKMSH